MQTKRIARFAGRKWKGVVDTFNQPSLPVKPGEVPGSRKEEREREEREAREEGAPEGQERTCWNGGSREEGPKSFFAIIKLEVALLLK